MTKLAHYVVATGIAFAIGAIGVSANNELVAALSIILLVLTWLFVIGQTPTK